MSNAGGPGKKNQPPLAAVPGIENRSTFEAETARIDVQYALLPILIIVRMMKSANRIAHQKQILLTLMPCP